MNGVSKSLEGPLHPLATKCLQTVGPLCDGCEYAIVDFPNYLNPGDSAIWVGARIMLARLYMAEPSYVSTLRRFDAEACKRAIKGGTVFFLGGGSFGSMYLKHHLRRLDALRAMKGTRVVMLPFSIAESADTTARCEYETAHIIRDHGRTELLVRETKSLQRLRERYDLDAIQCPDTAHFLSLEERVPRAHQVRLMRRDVESSSDVAGSASDDWSFDVRLRLLNRVGKLSDHIPSPVVKRRMYDALAHAKTELASARLGEGKTVVTDRLHGAILGEMLGRKVTAIDNATGKVAAYVRTWQGDLSNVTLCDSV